MNNRRLVGIDLGIATAHTVRVLDGQGSAVAKRRAWPTAESLTAVEAAAPARCPDGTQLEVVVEPTGRRGCRSRCSSPPAATRCSGCPRKRLRTCAGSCRGTPRPTASMRTPWPGCHCSTPPACALLVLPGAERAALDRRVRATDRLTPAAAEHKRRIKDLARQLLPMTPLTGDLGAADLAVLERYADPRALTRLGQARLAALITTASHGHQGAHAPASGWTPPRARWSFTPATPPSTSRPGRRSRHRDPAAARRPGRTRRPRRPARNLLPAVDQAGLARSLPGLAEVGGPALAACMGDPARFRGGKQFRSYTGLTPKASETGETDRKGQPMSKAGSSLLRTTMVRAADTARKQDPQLARIYYLQMTERGKDHLGALCVTAASLAERAWTVMRRGTPYIICDTDGRPTTPSRPKRSSPGAGPCHPTSAPAGAARRRGRPQKVLEGHYKRGSLPRHHSTSPRTARQADQLTTDPP